MAWRRQPLGGVVAPAAPSIPLLRLSGRPLLAAAAAAAAATPAAVSGCPSGN